MIRLISALALCAGIVQAQLNVTFPATDAAGSGNTLYALSNGHMYRTSDSGVSWTAVYPSAPAGVRQEIVEMAANPANPDIVYAATAMERGGIRKSTDRGATWVQVNSGLPGSGAVLGLYTVQNQAQTLYAVIGDSLYKTADGAASWQKRSTLPGTNFVFSVNVQNPPVMFHARIAGRAAPTNVIFRSTDEGATWTSPSTIAARVSESTNPVSTIPSSPLDTNLVFATLGGTESEFTGLYRSRNQGSSWTRLLPGRTNQAVINLRGDVFYTGAEESTLNAIIHRSTNQGDSWTDITFPTQVPGAPVLRLDLSQPDVMLAATSRGVYRSENRGVAWTPLAGTVRATLARPEIPAFQSPAGVEFTRQLTVSFLESNQWSAPFEARVEGADWLTLTGASGTATAAVTMRISTVGLANGTYTGTIRLTSPAAVQPTLVPVTLNVGDIPARPYRVSTVIGGGEAPPNGAQPAQAKLEGPTSVTVDPRGSLWVTDTAGHRIYQVSPTSGTLAAAAGTGTAGFSGDDGPAELAQLNRPSNISFAANGTYYIADSSNQRVRRVDLAGNIGSFAQSSTVGHVLAASNGDIYFSASTRIRKRTAAGVETDLSSTFISSAAQLAWDNQGNVLVADQNGHRILRISPAGAMTVVAGTGTRGFSGDGGPAAEAALSSPRGVGVDSEGNVFISDSGNFRIRMVDPSGVISTIAGSTAGFAGDGLLGPQARFTSLAGLHVASDGSIYVADTGSYRIRKLTPVRPVILSGGVTNAASYAATFAPGSLVAIFGEFQGAVTASVSSAPWATSLGGVGVTLNGQLMPLYYVSPTQINAMIPYEAPAGAVTLNVLVGGLSSANYSLTVGSASPGIIQFGENRAVAVNPNGTVNDPSNPVAPGSTVVVYMIGLGATNPPVATGAAAPLDVLVRPAVPASVLLGTTPVQPAFLGLTPGSVALAQLNLQIPEDTPDGTYPVQVTVGGVASNAPVITVRR